MRDAEGDRLERSFLHSRSQIVGGLLDADRADLGRDRQALDDMAFAVLSDLLLVG
jgi:hypothetical protein